MGGSGRLYVVLMYPYGLINASQTFGGKFESGMAEKTNHLFLVPAPLTNLSSQMAA